MSEARIRKIVVAGGGTAGWVTAAALVSQLGPLVEVELVESDEIGTVGVGEATIPTIRSFHRMLGIDERAFVQATGATFKLGIAFEDWGAIGDRYVHSFGQLGHATWMGGFQHLWLQAVADGYNGALGEHSFETQAAEAERFATTETINYAYHLDAARYAAFLRDFSTSRGVVRSEGRIVEVRRDAERGDITALVLDDGRIVAGDLFVDCTGFAGLLIERTLDAGYEDWGDWLPTDRALAVQTRAVEPARPYTIARAHDAGWRWKIPLQHRVGNGLVYCSADLSDDAAHARLTGALDGEMLTEPRVIRYRTGRRRQVWKHNCVALGLAGGFVEPLESTSIHLIMIGVTRLIQNFPFNGMNPALRRQFNDLAQIELERIRDFIILHYHLTQRTDSRFWERVRTMAIPETLAHRIALFREDAQIPISADELFRPDSWLQVMIGQRLQPRGHHRMGRLLAPPQLIEALTDLRRNIANGVAKLPLHQDFLEAHARG